MKSRPLATLLRAPGSLVTQPLSNLARHDVPVLLIQRQDRLIPCPNAETRLEQGDTIFVVVRSGNMATPIPLAAQKL